MIFGDSHAQKSANQPPAYHFAGVFLCYLTGFTLYSLFIDKKVYTFALG